MTRDEALALVPGQELEYEVYHPDFADRTVTFVRFEDSPAAPRLWCMYSWMSTTPLWTLLSNLIVKKQAPRTPGSLTNDLLTLLTS